jgi:DNA-binding NarL/FixJ family response regulator
VCTTLGKRSEFLVVCEVSDGLEAVRKAEELQPDLIVLDIGLPGIDGLEAARRIHKSCPASKILFLSLESDAHVVQESLRAGALGYVDKRKAEADLLAAVDALCAGRRFVSNGLLADYCTAATGAPGGHSNGDSLRPAPSESSRPHNRKAKFYSDDATLLGT